MKKKSEQLKAKVSEPSYRFLEHVAYRKKVWFVINW